MVDTGFRVTHEPFFPDSEYTDGTDEIRQPAVLVAIRNDVGFRPGKWLIGEVKVAWDGLVDKLAGTSDDALIPDRLQADVGLLYTTYTKAILRCHMDEADPPPNIDDANRLIEATKIALGRYGITASAELLGPGDKL